MAIVDKKIQIKDKDGNRLFPVTKAEALATTVPISKGGTGATTAAQARTNLDIYSKSEIESKLSAIDQFQYKIVTELPTASATTEFIIYLLKDSTAESGSYVEYLTFKDDQGVYHWEAIGTTSVDLNEYSKNTHNHIFTGKSATVSVSGTYQNATAVTISKSAGTANYTPEGTISNTRSSDVALNTTTVNSITSVGSLPSLKTGDQDITSFKSVNTWSAGTKTTTNDVTVATEGIKSVSSTFNGNKGSVSTEAGDVTYTPQGVISAPSFTGTIDLKSSSVVAGGVKYIQDISYTDVTTSKSSALNGSTTKYIHFNAGSTPVTGASFTGSATSVTTSGSIKPSGSINLGVNDTELGGVKYVEKVNSGSLSAVRHSYTPSGNISVTLSGTTLSTDGPKFIEDVSYTGASLTGTKTFVTGVTTSSASVLTGVKSTGSANVISSISTNSGTVGISYTAPTATKGDYTPGGSVGLTTSTSTSTGAVEYVSNVSGGGSSLTGDTTFVKTVSGSKGGYTPSGSVNLGSNSTSAGGVKYVESVSGSGELTGTTTFIKDLSGSVSSRTLTITSSTGTVGMSSGGVSAVTKYFHPTFSGSNSTSVLTGISSTNGTVGISGSGVTVSKKYLKAGFTGTKTNALVTGISSGGASLTGTKTFVTGLTSSSTSVVTGVGANGSTNVITTVTPTTGTVGISGGSISKTTKYLKNTGSFTGNATSSLVTDFNYTSPSGVTKYLHPTFSGSSQNVSLSGSCTPKGGISVTTGTKPSLTVNSESANGNKFIESVTSASNFVTNVTAGGINATYSYFHPEISGTVGKPTFTGTGVRLVTTPSGSISNTYSTASTTSISEVQSVGDLPSLTTNTVAWSKGSLPVKGSNTTVATGVKTQPEFTSRFTGTGVNLTASITHTSTSINSSGTYKPEGTIGSAQLK